MVLEKVKHEKRMIHEKVIKTDSKIITTEKPQSGHYRSKGVMQVNGWEPF